MTKVTPSLVLSSRAHFGLGRDHPTKEMGCHCVVLTAHTGHRIERSRINLICVEVGAPQRTRKLPYPTEVTYSSAHFGSEVTAHVR